VRATVKGGTVKEPSLEYRPLGLWTPQNPAQQFVTHWVTPAFLTRAVHQCRSGTALAGLLGVKGHIAQSSLYPPPFPATMVFTAWTLAAAVFALHG